MGTNPARRMGTGSVLTERPSGAKQSAGPSEERAVDSLTALEMSILLDIFSGGVPKNSFQIRENQGEEYNLKKIANCLHSTFDKHMIMCKLAFIY